MDTQLDYSDRASKVINSINARAWKLAESVGIPHDGCCLHNASVDDDMKSWCAGNPKRLAVAKRASRMMDEAWALSDLARNIERRAFNKSEGRVRLQVRPLRNRINVSLLFARV